ncbi:MAG TPA: MBL fold metallo-hydrolase [Pyrinomonadaceae bacterium]|jgi:beta-lactamase superfamily II metal-dependent hydrolase|nr:MBL fold metallo-hydrolase [Pyrinomonadaceae bacterium]
MPAKHLINVDLATIKVPAADGNKAETRVLAWGDEVEVVDVTAEHVEVKVTIFKPQPDGSVKPARVSGFIKPPKSGKIKPADIVVEKKDSRILKIDFVDVQQGDGSVIETPKGKVILIDGGDNQLFARYLANRFRGTSETKPREIDCILVTHGDADHFLGLTKIFESETDPALNDQKWKRLFIHPQRVYHNGFVKRPGKKKDGTKRTDIEMLGATKKVKDPKTGKDITVVTGLETDLLKVPDEEMNEPFLAWKEALKAYKKRGAIKFRRLEKGDTDAFDFLQDEGVKVQVLGPIPTEAGSVRGLKFLGNPPTGPRVGQESLNLEGVGFSGASASHTINGHSVIFRLCYGPFNFLFTGDLNDEAGQALTRAHNQGAINLQSEVFKVPHHGSADFSGAFIQAVAPVISVVSSGDESARKEFIHPRATIMGALGRYSRVEEPLIFVTELVAFFQVEGLVSPECHVIKDGKAVVKDGEATLVKKPGRKFFAFSRAAFGIVMVRTDGERLLVYTNSGQATLKEAYAYKMNDFGKPEPTPVRKV